MKHFLITLALLGTLPALAVAPRFQHEPLKFMPKAKAYGESAGKALPAEKAPAMRVAAKAQDFAATLPTGDLSGYLDGPDLSTYYYTMDYKVENIDHGTFVDQNIKGFKLSVYDPNFELVGVVEDDVDMKDGETRIVQVSVGPQLTKKFFNYDNNVEVMVCVVANTAEHVNTNRTVVYSLGKEDALMEIEGYYISAINTATDDWSEKFWITFMTEEVPDDASGDEGNPTEYVFTTYKSAGYSGLGDPMLKTRIPVMHIAGENMIPFLATQKDGIPYFAVNQWRECWYEDPWDFTNDNPRANNALIVDVYTLPTAYASTIEKYATTEIPNTSTADNLFFTYIGNFAYDKDLSLTDYAAEDGTPGLVVTREHYVSGNDGYNYDYLVYPSAKKGTTATSSEPSLTIASGVEGGYFMADLEGQDPQVMFVRMDDGVYTFEFVNPLTGEMQHTFPFDITDDIKFSTSVLRVANGSSYLYAVAQTRGGSNENGDMITAVAYITPDGKIDHIDNLNLGKDVVYATVYMGSDALNPYIFNADDNMEYMVLVKRLDNSNSVANHEELMVVSANEVKEPLLILTPHEEYGNLASMFLSNLDGDKPSLVIVYAKDYRYTVTSHDLPLQTYDAGDGTAQNPYQINTLGGLLMMRHNPSANYILTADIDASSQKTQVRSWTFSGSLDGDGHIITNLRLDGSALFPFIQKADESEIAPTVKNLKLVRPVLDQNTDGQGILAGTVSGGIIENVHVYDGVVNANGDVAGLIGKAVLYTEVRGCSVDADINQPEATTTGGVVGATRTTSSIISCAFTGTITGGTEVGGIVGALENAADKVSDCHVNAVIKANNTIGGIAGSSKRALVERCHVEGTLEATAANRWGGGPKLGGVIGSLEQSYEEVEEDPAKVVKGNYVNLTALVNSTESTTENYAGQNDTMHRIVGASAVNNEPEVVDLDQNWEPIYGDPWPADAGLADNYANSKLEVVTAAVGASATSTEGATKEWSDDESPRAFFEGLGYKYGDEIETPWSMTGDLSCPTLFFEGGLLLVTPAQAEVAVGETVAFSLSLAGRDLTEEMLDSFAFEISDESLVEVAETSFEGGIINVVVKGVAPGTAELTFNLAGKQTVASVVVKKEDSIDSIVTDASKLTLEGRTAVAPDCQISAFSVSGMQVAAGYGRCDLSQVAAGVYVLVATDAQGNRSTLKAVIR